VVCVMWPMQDEPDGRTVTSGRTSAGVGRMTRLGSRPDIVADLTTNPGPRDDAALATERRGVDEGRPPEGPALRDPPLAPSGAARRAGPRGQVGAERARRDTRRRILVVARALPELAGRCVGTSRVDGERVEPGDRQPVARV